MPYRKLTIRQQGLRNYLGDELYTKFVYHYQYQSLLVAGTKKHINATAIGKALDLNFRTIKEYIKIHEAEQNKPKGGEHAED